MCVSDAFESLENLKLKNELFYDIIVLQTKLYIFFNNNLPIIYFSDSDLSPLQKLQNFQNEDAVFPTKCSCVDESEVQPPFNVRKIR